MANETIAQAHRNLARLFSASTSAAVAAGCVFAGFAVPMKLSRMSEYSTMQIWGLSSILEMVVIGGIAVMIRDIYAVMRG